MAADSPAPLEPGLYAVAGEAVGSLAPKFRGMSYAFMVTSAISADSEIQMWCADLVPYGKVPVGKSLAGKDVWALHGHPSQNSVFVADGDALVECDATFTQRHVWQRSNDFNRSLLREAAAPPISAEKFPSENFVETVINKNPALNEPFSPSTQTIVEACAYFSGPLSEDPIERQEQLVMLYTAETPLYHEMNKALREDNPDKLRYFGAYIKELRDVFKTDHEEQIITPFEGIVWRGICFPDAEAALREYLPGHTFVWPAFTSMSTEMDAAMGFGNVVFEITCFPPPGHYEDDTPEYAPASVEQWSCFQTEHEILFPPNIRFKVQAVIPPDHEAGLTSTLVRCQTVGFDTDEGIVEFGQSNARGGERTGEDAELQAQIAQLQEELRQLRSRLDACRERADRCDQRLDSCEEGAKAGGEGLQHLQKVVQDLQGCVRAALPTAGSQDTRSAAPREVLQLREELEREAAARAAADRARQQDHARLRERCDDLQTKVLDLSNAAVVERSAGQSRFEDFRAEIANNQRSMQQDFSRVSQKIQAMLAESLSVQKSMDQEVVNLSNAAVVERSAAQRQFEDFRAEIANNQRSMQQDFSRVSQKIQAMLAESLSVQKSMDQEVCGISAQVHEQLCADHRRTNEMDAVLKGLTDRCYMTSMILAAEKLKHETLDLKGLLAVDPRRERERARSSARGRAVEPANSRATLDAAVQGIGDIKNVLETLRGQLPKDTTAESLSSTRWPVTETTSNNQPQGAEQVAVGGALQAARAARRPSDAMAATAVQS